MGMNNDSRPIRVISFAIATATLIWGAVYFATKAKSAEAPKYTIELDAADLQSLGLALNELPKRVADPLIAKINAQLQPKTPEPAPTPTPTPEPKKD